MTSGAASCRGRPASPSARARRSSRRLADIGLIIVDEEHDASYKQEGGLHYSARDLAVVRARQSGCPALLGSATPSLQSIFNVRTGKYTELRLTCRVEARPLPEIRVVDLRQCKDLRGPGRFISGELRQAMAETLGRGEQVLLFLNRRGFASFPVCAACGSALRCRNCDISLTLHQSANAYQCHYCGFSRPATAACEACGSDKIKRLGLGTEKVEEAVRALFPPARIARMDRDTTQRKGAIVGMLKRLRAGEIDILVGTQMVAKGHDFPGITLVGILCADLSLSFPDFRAGEHTFQLLAQVAGRAGRGERPGRVILQTYNPEHFSIRTARDQDYDAFYEQEIEFRRALGYPPVTRLIQLRISAQDPRQAQGGGRGPGPAMPGAAGGGPGICAGHHRHGAGRGRAGANRRTSPLADPAEIARHRAAAPVCGEALGRAPGQLQQPPGAGGGRRGSALPDVNSVRMFPDPLPNHESP